MSDFILLISACLPHRIEGTLQDNNVNHRERDSLPMYNKRTYFILHPKRCRM